MIIQDDENDWPLEFALMSEIYSNAVVNLAATDAKDGSVGLFHERCVASSTTILVDQIIKNIQTPGRLILL